MDNRNTVTQSYQLESDQAAWQAHAKTLNDFELYEAIRECDRLASAAPASDLTEELRLSNKFLTYAQEYFSRFPRK